MYRTLTVEHLESFGSGPLIKLADHTGVKVQLFQTDLPTPRLGDKFILVLIPVTDAN